MTKNDKIKAIKHIIQRDGLDVQSRHQVLTMRRRYLMAELRALNLPFHGIGEYFNRGHATVMHNINQHNWAIESGDLYYITVIQDDIDELNGSANVKKLRFLRDEILKCRSYNQLKAIKRRVLRNEYDELLSVEQ
jgi:hypothetical protein